MEIKIKPVTKDSIPVYKTTGAACADCVAAESKFVWLKPVLIPLGFCLGIPEHYEAQIRPRSGMSKKGHFVSLGTIDSDYRGEVKANMWSILPYRVKKGDRVAQIFFGPAPKVDFEVVFNLDDTERGTGGFGSTGK